MDVPRQVFCLDLNSRFPLPVEEAAPVLASLVSPSAKASRPSFPQADAARPASCHAAQALFHPVTRQASLDVARAASRRVGHPGTFGLALTGSLVPVLSPGLQAAPSSWPLVDVGWTAKGASPLETEHIGEGRAQLRVGSGMLDCGRAEGTALFRTYRPLREEELLHPGLGMVATVFGHWLGRLVFHGGAVVVDEAAWVVIGDKEAGKSTTLAWLGAAGFGVMADDLVVVEGDRVLAGPRCLDLREPTIQHLADMVDPTMVRAGLRGRILLPHVPPEVPLGGWVVLERSEAISVVRVPAAQRIALLGLNLAARLTPADPTALLDLARFPVWRLRRPLHLDVLAESVDRLLETITRSRPQQGAGDR